MIHYRQGDVLLIRLKSMPPATLVPHERIVERGELTGHAHRLEGAAAIYMSRSADAMFVRVLADARLVHEEHAPIDLPPGDYEVRRQREFTDEGERHVRD